MASLPRNDESLRVCDDTLDIVALAWTVLEEHFVVAGGLEEHYFALVGADDEAAVGQPGVAGEVVGDVRFLFDDGGVRGFEVAVFLDFVVLEGVVTSYQNNIRVLVME